MDPVQSYYEVGSNITLTCSVTYPNSPLIDINTTVYIHWRNYSNITIQSYTAPNDYKEHTLNYTISNMRLSDAGQYTCYFFINVTTNRHHIIESKSTIAFEAIIVKGKCMHLYFTLCLISLRYWLVYITNLCLS